MTLLWRRVSIRWTQAQAAAEETVLEAQSTAQKAFAQQLRRIHSLMTLHELVLHGSLFTQKGSRDQREGTFSGYQPSSGLQATMSYLPPSSGRSESLFRISAPCSLLLVLFSMYSFFKHFLISRSRSLQ